MSNPTERLHALDAVRGGALLLGVVFHAAFSFVPGMIAGVWATADASPSATLGALVFVSHVFRMSLFFFLAGFLGRAMFHRKGARAFWADRAKRIAVPLVVGWAVLFPAIAALWVWGIGRYYAALGATGGVPEAPVAPEKPLLAFPLTHLWFLWVLLLLYAVVVGTRSLVARIDRSGRMRSAIDRAVSALVRSGTAAPVLAAPTALLLWRQAAWIPYFGIPTPDQSLLPSPVAFVAFATAFGFGWLAERQPALLATWRRSWALHLAGAIAATAGCLALVGVAPTWIPVAPSPRTLGIAALYALALWCWTFGLLGAATRFLARESAARRYVADASYWIYLAHLPVVVFFQVLVAPLAWSWAAKFPLVLGASFAVLFASYHLLVRFTFVGALLNGKRRRRGTASLAASPDSFSKSAAPAGGLGAELPERAGSEPSAPLAELVGARKRFGKVLALDGVDLAVGRGEILAVLGPNGAGKTTAISAWLGLVAVDEGEARLVGRSPFDVTARREVGVMMQEATLPATLRVGELIELTAGYYPDPMPLADVLAASRTETIAKRPGAKLSGGQKRLAQFAAAICGRPRLLFLDEPTANLDVEARATIWALVRRFRDEGGAVVLTTHHLEEAEALADRVAVLRAGKVIALGTVDEVRSIVHRRTIRCTSALDVAAVRAWPGVVDARRDASRLEIVAREAEPVVRRLLEHDERLADLEVRAAGLTEAFQELTKEAA